MQTADKTSGPAIHADNVLLIVSHHDLHTCWPEHLSKLDPNFIRKLVADRYGNPISYFISRHRLVHHHSAPLDSRPLKEALRWIEASFLPVYDIERQDLATRNVVAQLDALRPHTLIWIGTLSTFSWKTGASNPTDLLVNLQKRGIRLVVLSPEPVGTNNLVGYMANEMFNLQEIVQNKKLPPPPEAPNGIYACVPTPTKYFFESLALIDTNLHRIVRRLIDPESQEDHHHLRQDIRYLWRDDSLPNLVLALLLLLATAPSAYPKNLSTHRDSLPDYFVNMEELVEQLKAHGIHDEKDEEHPIGDAETAAWNAAQILYETGCIDLVYDDDRPRFFYKKNGDSSWPAHVFAKKILGASTGQGSLDGVIAALEIFFTDKNNLSQEACDHIQDWLSSTHNQWLSDTELERRRLDWLENFARTDGTNEERIQRYRLFGIRDIADVNRFEQRLVDLFEQSRQSIDSTSDESPQSQQPISGEKHRRLRLAG